MKYTQQNCTQFSWMQQAEGRRRKKAAVEEEPQGGEELRKPGEIVQRLEHLLWKREGQSSEPKTILKCQVSMAALLQPQPQKAETKSPEQAGQRD